MTLAAFATICLIHLAAAISPGPSFVVCVRTAATEGFRTASALSLGFGLGAALWAGAALAGLSLIFELVPQLFIALKIAGGMCLLWIAYKVWQHAKDPMPESNQQNPRSIWGAIRFGFLTFASNPKPAVFFGAVFMGLMPPDTPAIWRLAILFAVFLNETLWYILVARMFSYEKPRQAYARLKTTVDRCFGGLIALFGAKIALG